MLQFLGEKLASSDIRNLESQALILVADPSAAGAVRPYLQHHDEKHVSRNERYDATENQKTWKTFQDLVTTGIHQRFRNWVAALRRGIRNRLCSR
jgi:hypothetical protein